LEARGALHTTPKARRQKSINVKPINAGKMEWIEIKNLEKRAYIEALVCNEAGHKLFGWLEMENGVWNCYADHFSVMNVTHYCIVELPQEKTECPYCDAIGLSNECGACGGTGEL
jgi:hypothetical protein